MQVRASMPEAGFDVIGQHVGGQIQRSTSGAVVIPQGAGAVTVPALSRPDFDPSTAPDVTSSFTATAIRASSYAGDGDLRARRPGDLAGGLVLRHDHVAPVAPQPAAAPERLPVA